MVASLPINPSCDVTANIPILMELNVNVSHRVPGGDIYFHFEFSAFLQYPGARGEPHINEIKHGIRQE